MDAKRLEELAERLMLGEFTIEDQRDAARCAAAWAKVERELREHDGTSIDFVVGNKGQVMCLGYFGKAVGDTAIAAVEAAPEVGP